MNWAAEAAESVVVGSAKAMGTRAHVRGPLWTEESACDEESEGYATALPTLVMSSSVPT